MSARLLAFLGMVLIVVGAFISFSPQTQSFFLVGFVLTFVGSFMVLTAVPR